MNPTTLQIIASTLFGIAVIHTFSSAFFERLAHKQPNHAGLWHLLGEVEAVFGFWAMILIVFMAFAAGGYQPSVEYLESRNYTEPLFVFAIMVVAASRPVLHFASELVRLVSGLLSKLFRINNVTTSYFVTLSLVPLLGSFITEPAAMTLAALLLKKKVFSQTSNAKLMYLTIGVLFVNISIGGALTSFAAPPILMVASAWGWDTAYVFKTFGMKAALAVIVNATLVTLLVRRDLPKANANHQNDVMPIFVVAVHLLFLAGIVVFAHHPVVFMGLLLFFMGYTHAYAKFQNPLLLKEALMVAFFLAGLVVLGGMQQWWLQPILENMSTTVVYYGATALTAITDNAALTYLGSLVEGTSEEFKYALVAGAITGGGLTVIANAPNPAGMSILREHFPDGSVSPLWLFLAALPPTIVAIIAFQFI
jgi:Na+/H+ antiporter NhaD/arsenite permease-like protein